MESSNSQPNTEELKINEKKDEVMDYEKDELKEKGKAEEQQFVKLFDAVLQQNRGNLSDGDIAEGVAASVSFFREDISSACAREKYNTPKILSGFFHRYSPLYAGKTRRIIVYALLGCEKLRFCFHRPSLKIVDVGSGAGSALVGLYSALYEGGFPFQSLEVTAVDYNKNWEIFFNAIVKKLCEDNFGYASRLFKEKEINCSFVCFDAFKDGCEKETCLNEADIIFMKGVVSILRNDDDRYKIMRDVASAMEPGSLLVYIESPTYVKYFERENSLSLVFQTTTVLPTSSVSQSPDVPFADCQSPLDSNLNTQASSFSSEDRIFTSPSPWIESQTYNPVLQVSGSASHHIEKNNQIMLRPDTDNRFNFSAPGVSEYGQGFASISNQEIFILEKKH
ncbi:hypothetical protein AVEN_133711-1 [Araneus ventricosus]|uniref:Uncharacterized protein n=1 Tax=Araneus ventricosus TaxID=182803 RepID=A0A4Y2BAC7_ARAVE|nr:hypothetical protein AVEN_133711-1 [Araneus ventricosus]